MRKVIVVAPHPDDETLGCGGTLLRHKQTGDEIHWLLLTTMMPEQGFSANQIAARTIEIAEVAERYGFSGVHTLDFPTTQLDALPKAELIASISKVFYAIKPEVVYLPYKGDVHSDHVVAADAVLACCKWFRNSAIKRILAYETLSETEFGISADTQGFRPNVYVNITEQLEDKIQILQIFASELGEFPFPRSPEAVRALAQYRGISSGCEASEAFVLLREIL